MQLSKDNSAPLTASSWQAPVLIPVMQSFKKAVSKHNQPILFLQFLDPRLYGLMLL